MKTVWVISDSVVSPLGNGAGENFDNVLESTSGISLFDDPQLSAVPITAGKIKTLKPTDSATRFESMCLDAVRNITNKFSPDPDRTIFILSTTKGNINLAEEDQRNPRIQVHETAAYLVKHIGLKNHLVISNACISGVMAMVVAKRFLLAGKYDHALILGADELTQFVVSGFQSLQALSNELCRPFDVNRKGINLGEAAAAILLSVKPDHFGVEPKVRVLGGGLTNDANHISGPSRTGEELAAAIARALGESQVTPSEIDFISAHGTATVYNDEMEAKAFTLAGLQQTPVNSLKGYYGHTLGAAGVIETVLSIHSLLNDRLIATKGYETSGVSQPLNVITKQEFKPLKRFLKTASGFGGCNAAIVLEKVNNEYGFF